MYLIICKNQKAIDFLISEWCLLGIAAKKEIPVECGDALVARDILLKNGFQWGKDFYLKKINDGKLA